MNRRGARIGTSVFVALLMAWGAAHTGAGGPPGAATGPSGRAPAVVPARAAVLDPLTGAATWSSAAPPSRNATPGRVVLNPATVVPVPLGPLSAG